MSPWMFNLFIDGVVREVNTRLIGMGVKMLESGSGGVVMEWLLDQLLFADDTTIVAESEEQL